MKPKLIVVAGPTAVGKTEYAIKLAKENDGEIVSLDSMQVYKKLDIGTAKPSQNELKEVRHYMIDEVMPSVNLNVKEYKEMAMKYIDSILKRGKLPILVGGTGFYINAVLYDTVFLDEDEKEALSIRKELENICAEKGDIFIHEMLEKIDKKSAELIPVGNSRRVIRAITFYRLHNIPISEHNESERKRESKFDYKFYVLNMDRDRLYSRINERVDKMIKDGLLIEIKQLIDGGFTKDLNAMQGIGYKELYDFCEKRNYIYDIDTLDDMSKSELQEIIEQIKMHSRNYAKRQLTWFRAQKNIEWIER